MTRLIKRYGSRKLYDTRESRYVLLEDISEWVRQGEEIQVVDNATDEDVTAQTLTQVIADEGRRKSQFLSSDLLHDLIRAGESALSNGVKQLQSGMDRFVKRSLDRITPVRQVRDEMDQLRERLNQLEQTLSGWDGTEDASPDKPPKRTKTSKAKASKKVKSTTKSPTKSTAKSTAKKKTSKAKSPSKPAKGKRTTLKPTKSRAAKAGGAGSRKKSNATKN